MHTLTQEQYALGVARLKLASLLQFTLPGVPSIYYGDEIGMQGYSDPFNRRFFEWEKRNEELLSWYRQLGTLRRRSPVLAKGDFARVPSPEGSVCYMRSDAGKQLLAAVNRGSQAISIYLPQEYDNKAASLGVSPQGNCLTLQAMEYSVLEV